MTNKIWEITDKGLNLVLEYQERKKEGGEYREFMKTFSPKLESGKTIKEEERSFKGKKSFTERKNIKQKQYLG